MDREFSDFISQVLDKTDIVRLISRYVKLEKKGNTYWACCPFHNEKTASFAVNEGKQFFHCFGCKESGNAISFVKKIENVEFYDALKILAEQAGLEMPKSNGSYVKTDKKERDALYNLMRDAARHYHDNLSDPRAKPYRDYLTSRQMPESMVRRFGLGASLDFTEMITYLSGKGYTFEQMKKAGIAETKDDRKYDVFGKRLIFPIIDNMGHVVAFGGRTLEKDPDFAKYRNSAQTEIFDKSKVIYGVNLLKKRKAERPIDYVIMTEGYMDVISLHKAGFDTTVASMGTALTARQARQLKNYSDLVYISYDGDTAGQKATMRGLDILRECGLIVKVVRLPDGLDPDDVVKRYGSEGYKKLLDEAIPLTAYKIETLRSKYDFTDPDRKAMFAIEAAKVINALENPIEQEQYLSYVSRLTDFSTDALKRQADISARDSQTALDKTEKPTALTDSEKFFLSSIIQGAEFIDFDRDVTQAFSDPRARKVYEFCRENRMSNMTALFESDYFDEGDRAFIDDVLDYRQLPGDGRAKFFDVETSLYRRVLEGEVKRLKELLNETKDQNILIKLRDVSSELGKLRLKT